MKAGPEASLAVGPLNSAGQGFHWAEACASHLGVSAFSFASPLGGRRIKGPSHRLILHHRVRPTLVKELGARVLLRNVTHLMDESFATITGDQRSENLTRDLSWLGERGISVGVVFHGSDVRSPSSHIARESASYFRLLATQDVTRWEESTAIRRSLARESGLPLFVSTPDLLVDLPEATWLPLVTNLAIWRSIAPAFLGKKLRVLHVPSRRLPPIKGTSYIDPVLTKLANRGIVEYISPTSVAHERMPDLVRSVDVVIDQLLTGSYGVTAVEAMAAGRLVIGNVGRDVRFTVPRNIPIVDCPPSDLEELILAIVADPTYYAGIAAEGPGFAEELHSGARSASALRNWLIPSPAVEDSR